MMRAIKKRTYIAQKYTEIIIKYTIQIQVRK